MPELVGPTSTSHVLASTADKPVDQQVTVSVTTDPPVGVLLDSENIENQVEKSLFLMAALVTDWNLTQNGQPLPITADNLRKLTPALFGDLFKIISALASDVTTSLDTEKKI